LEPPTDSTPEIRERRIVQRLVRQYGLIAEEVATVYPEPVTRTATGEVQAVRYQELIPMVVKLQRLPREVAELRTHGQLPRLTVS